MRQLLCSVSFAFGLALATGASAAEMIGENLLLGVPAGFKVGFQDRKGPILVTEMVPEKETADEWTEKLSSQIFVGLKSVTPAEFEKESRRQWLEVCKEGKFSAIASGEEKGYLFSVWMLSCPYSKAPGRPETAIFKALRGASDLYVVQKAFRFELAREQVAQWMQFLKEVSLCDSRVPEKACPKFD